MNIIALLSLMFFLIFCSPNNKGQIKNKDNNTSYQNDIKANNNATKKIYEIEINNSKINDKPTGKVEYLSTEDFIAKVFDYRINNEWKYRGKVHCVIDFYADWCAPCRRVSPIMEELAQEYANEIQFYKVNIDYEKEIAQVFGIRSIPAIMICPLNGTPAMAIGALLKQEYQKMISEVIYK